MSRYAGRSRSRSHRQPVAPAAWVSIGVVLILLAIVVYAASQFLAGRQRHAYDPGASPLSAYHLTAGRSYQLSTAGGVSELTKERVLSSDITPVCTRAGTASSDGESTALKLDSTNDDARDLRVFATFTATVTGSFHISCQKIADVFVDDADNSEFDLGGALVLLATLIGLVGAIAALSGGYRLSEANVQARAAAAAEKPSREVSAQHLD
jgi:hypothetical protein